MVSLYLDTVRAMIMTYMLLLHCLHPYFLQLSFCHYSYYVIINNLLLYFYIYLLAEITLKLELQSTEAYFPHIAYAFFYVRRSVLFKIHAANIEASNFFVLFFVGDHGKLFLKISQMLVVCICYCYN